MEDAIYSEKLAYSMHLALQEEGGPVWPLNHNSGILYARADKNPDGTLTAKCLDKPWLFSMEDGSFGVIARRILPDGSADGAAKGALLFFRSGDLIYYQEQPLLDLGRENRIEDVSCVYDEKKGTWLLAWKEQGGEWLELETDALETKRLQTLIASGGLRTRGKETESRTTLVIPAGSGLPEGAVVRNVLEIDEKTAAGLKIRFLTPENTANRVPDQIRVSSPEELKAVGAMAEYSDGSSVKKRVDWDMDAVDWSRPGRYTVEGRVHQDRYEFPVAWHKADPCIGRWKGKYYFISTNDLDHEHSIYIREADSIPGLVTAQQTKILDAYTYPHLGNLLWAPEFHIIKDRLYVFHAGTPGEFVKEQCHVMALKENGNPMKASDWEMPVRVVKKDGSPLYGEEGITLDMTEFEVGGKYYVCWSQRQFFPVDQGAWLYIALIDPDEPWRLTSDPVLLSMPEYSWANNHTFVDEGPFALIRDNRILLTFSSAAVDSTYVVGLLSADADADLLNPASWRKENYPLLTSRSVDGEYGTGHNAYVTDEYGHVFNTYHARPGVEGPRSSGIRRVHFNAAGFPVLDMTEEMDLKPELAAVKTEVFYEP